MTKTYSRFTVMFFWMDKKVDIVCNARVNNLGGCNSECEKCNVRAKICYDCKGRLLGQGKYCVKRCSGGHVKSGKRCIRCRDRYCQYCSRINYCQKCRSGRYLKGRNCVRSCGRNFAGRRGVCVSKGSLELARLRNGRNKRLQAWHSGRCLDVYRASRSRGTKII